jgi:tetratricopeptide (TPR) repeat protein
LSPPTGPVGRLELLRRADALIDLKRYAPALHELAPLLAGPDDGQALCRASRALIGLDRHREAADMAGRAIAADPNAEWGYRLRSISLIAMSRASQGPQKAAWQAEALSAARHAVRLAPMNPVSYRCAADAEISVGDYRSAHDAATRAIELAPAAAESWNTDCRVALAQGDLARAEHRARRAVELNPAMSEAWNNLGVVLQRDGRWNEAVRAYLHAARLDPSASLTRGNIARSGLILVRMMALIVMLPLVLIPDGVVAYLVIVMAAYFLFRPGGPKRDRAEAVGIRAAIRFDRLSVPGAVKTAVVQLGSIVVGGVVIVAAVVGLANSQPGVAAATVLLCIVLYVVVITSRFRRGRAQGPRTITFDPS